MQLEANQIDNPLTTPNYTEDMGNSVGGRSACDRGHESSLKREDLS